MSAPDEQSFSTPCLNLGADAPALSPMIRTAIEQPSGFGLKLSDQLAAEPDTPGPVAALDPRGCATEPDHALLLLDRIGDADDRLIARLIREVLNRAQSAGFDRVIARSDPMDRRHIRILESCGFRPTGRMAYREVGSTCVEYVDGYQDATGSLVDLVCQLDQA